MFNPIACSHLSQGRSLLSFVSLLCFFFKFWFSYVSKLSVTPIFTEIVLIFIWSQLIMLQCARFSPRIKNPSVDSGCSLLFGRVVVSFTNSPFPFWINEKESDTTFHQYTGKVYLFLSNYRRSFA